MVSSTVERDVAVGSHPRRPVLLGAWIATFLGSMAPRFVAETVFGVNPPWILWVQLAAIGGFLALTVADERFRGLQVYGLAMLVFQVQFAVGWSDVAGLLGLPTELGLWFTVAYELTEFLFTAAFLVALLTWRYDRDDLFLRGGELSATFEATAVPGPWAGRSWRVMAPVVGGVFVLIGFAYVSAMGASSPFAGRSLAASAAVAVVIVVAAGLNAFSEEFVFRAAPATDLLETVGKRQTLLLLAAFFGLSHYYGSPGGPIGVLLTGAFAWIAGKSILETRGIGIALLIHFVADLIVISTWMG